MFECRDTDLSGCQFVLGLVPFFFDGFIGPGPNLSCQPGDVFTQLANVGFGGLIGRQLPFERCFQAFEIGRLGTQLCCILFRRSQINRKLREPLAQLPCSVFPLVQRAEHCCRLLHFGGQSGQIRLGLHERAFGIVTQGLCIAHRLVGELAALFGIVQRLPGGYRVGL